MEPCCLGGRLWLINFSFFVKRNNKSDDISANHDANEFSKFDVFDKSPTVRIFMQFSQVLYCFMWNIG